LNSLSELTDDIESQLKQFDETTGRIAVLSGTIESLEADAQNVRLNPDNLDLASRVKKLSATTAQLDLLRFDLENHQAEADQQKKAILAASVNLRSRCIGDAGALAHERRQQVVSELGRDFDTKRLPIGIAQIAEAHQSVQALRETERALQTIDSTDESKFDFARRVRTDFLGKLT
jgi:hypothetical protein